MAYERIVAKTTEQDSANPMMPAGGKPGVGSRNGGGGEVTRETGTRDCEQNAVPRMHSYAKPASVSGREIPSTGGVAGRRSGGRSE